MDTHFLCYGIAMETKQSKRNQHVYECPIEATVDLVGGKWKAIVLHHLLIKGTLRFGEIKKKMPTVTQKMLTAQLRQLATDGLITRTVYPVVPPRVEYELTPLGVSLGPILVAMKDWGEAYV